jgi:23S rRNA pseudouridine2605 synthase
MAVLSRIPRCLQAPYRSSMTTPPRRRTATRQHATVPLERALSKLGLASRTEARGLIAGGRVTVDGVVIRDAMKPVVPECRSIAVDGIAARRAPWRVLLVHKPSGVITTRRDPEGRPTIYDVLRGVERASELKPVGRLDFRSSGLLLLTSDTRLADWLTDPGNAIVRRYVVTARGEIADRDAARMIDGIEATIGSARVRLAAQSVTLLKRSRRETHLLMDLTEGRNREIRRLIEACGSEVTRLKRVAFGRLELGDLPPGAWRSVTREEMASAFPDEMRCGGASPPHLQVSLEDRQGAERRRPELAGLDLHAPVEPVRHRRSRRGAQDRVADVQQVRKAD